MTSVVKEEAREDSEDGGVGARCVFVEERGAVRGRDDGFTVRPAPAADAEVLRAMLEYSPYHGVAPHNYPPMLLSVALNDRRTKQT